MKGTARKATGATEAAGTARSGWWRQVGALVWKDLRAEARTRESLMPMLVFSFVVVTVFGFGLEATGVDLRSVFPGLMWVSFYFIGLLGLGRSFAVEKAQDTLTGLSLVPSDPSFIFFGKLLANLVFLGVVELISMPLFFAMLGVPFTAPFFPFALIVVLGTLGFASVGTLLSAIAVHTRAGEMLLPVLVFPIMIPAVIGSVEATASLLGLGDPQGWHRWGGLLLAYDTLFLVLPLVVFEYLLEP